MLRGFESPHGESLTIAKFSPTCKFLVLLFGELSGQVQVGRLCYPPALNLLLLLSFPPVSRTSITQDPFYDLVSARKKKIANKN